MAAQGPWRTAAILLGIAALLLPSGALVDALATRVNTVRDFRDDYLRGLVAFRVALAVAGAFAAILPRLLERARLVPRTPGPLVDPADRAPAFLLAAIGLAAALPGLGQSFQDDEYRCLTAYIVHGPAIILTRSAGDSHLLQSLLSWIPVAWLGPSETAVRLPPLLLGSTAPAMLYLLLRRRHAPGAAFAASLPLAAWPMAVQYVAEGRGYAPLAPLLFLLARLVPPLAEGNRGAWTGAVAAGAAAVGFHLFAAPVVAALFLAPLAARERRTAETSARLGTALGVVACLSLLGWALVLPQTGDFAASLVDAPWTRPADVFAGALGALAWPAPAWTGLLLAPLVLLGREPGAAAWAAALLL
jgi:hypothetical protein